MEIQPTFRWCHPPSPNLFDILIILLHTNRGIDVKERLQPFEDYRSDLDQAEQAMRGIVPVVGGLRQHLLLTSVEGIAWLVGDLHERNIMRDANGSPTIVDALVGEVTAEACRDLPWHNAARADAESFRETGRRPPAWDESVDDAEL